jgi:putative hydrolase of HD superfamily
MLLADELIGKGVHIDVTRILRMSLLHDWAEARIGDMPRTAAQYFGSTERKRAEIAAFCDMVKDLENQRTYSELFDEYESRETMEARLVKAADIIDLLVQVLALERAGARGLDEFWDVTREFDLKFEGPAHELMGEILGSLLEQRREVMGL